ncbi:dynamin family protein [Paraliomyxa miuraensis]|uniref:dynamin family protein n=1 Tax=Paraliomyxa miuraensis TaxID=376150 RepID=UPI00225B7F5F|nr:dynamin family protein [Paraliomyxa miuraensis]MCX4244054.1 dynamin family protein [Paraliomyxa miuraensis]
MSTTTSTATTQAPTPSDARNVLLGHAKTLADIATELGLPDLARTIEADTRRRLDDHRVRAVVLGEIKQGKSTLINAILGDDALPTGVTPTTGAVATVRVGRDPGTFLCREGSSGEATREPLDPERFSALATGREKAEAGAAVELVVGAGALPPSLELIDTPGMNDMERVRGAISRGELPRADVLVLVLDATQLLNRTELAFLRDAVAAVGGLSGSGARLLLAINRIDLVDERDRPLLVEYLRREVKVLAGEAGEAAIEIFQTDARGALRRPNDDSFGIEEVRRLRRRIIEIADGHADLLPARARASLARHSTLLAHNAAIAARALTLEELALRREIRAIEREVVDHESDLVVLREQLAAGQAKLQQESEERIDRFRDDLRASTLACIDAANLRILSNHLPGSLHDAFLAFGREESEHLRVELDELTRQAIRTHGEQARRRLFQATMRLGFRGPPIYIDPPSVVLEAGLVAIGLVGTAVMYFGSLVAGLTMTVAGPLATVVLREKSLREARARAKAELPGALERASEALRESIRRVIEQHVAAVEEHLVLANVALGRQLVAVLEQARERLGPDDASDAAQRRALAQHRLLELERKLYGLRHELRDLAVGSES